MSIRSDSSLADAVGVPPRGACDERVLAASRVVIVDDVPANVALLERVLRAAGVLDVHGVTDSQHAVVRILEIEPDLVLLDLHMPGVDGFDVLTGLQAADARSEFLPVLVMTADATTATKERALSSGATDFLTKPFERTEVVLRVRNLLRTRSLYRRLEKHNAELQSTLEEQTARARQVLAHTQSVERRIAAALQPGSLTMAFQPIADLVTGAVVGAEALSRFSCEPQRSPDQWFAEAAEVGRSVQLEVAAVLAAGGRLDDLPAGAFLAVNVSPDTAMSDELQAALADVPAERLVLELTEHRRVEDYARLLEALEPLRTSGGRIAVDDAGAGYAGLRHILQLSPDVLKLDTDLTRGIDTDPVRRALAAALVGFARELDAVIVAEGIETAGERAVLRDLGVAWGQGYHLARPGPLPLSSDRLDVTRPG